MASNFNELKELLAQQAELKARISQIPFDGSIEVKECGSNKYLYARTRVAGKNTSTYIGPYSEDSHALLMRQAIDLRALKKSLRAVQRQLAKLGYVDSDLNPKVLLNIDFARANMKTLIYGQAVLEGVSTTFPQTEDIIDNGIVSGVSASDVQKILNLKHAWEFILDRDVVACPSDMALLSRAAALVNDGFYEYGGRIRMTPVRIGGTTYVPMIPTENQIASIIHNSSEDSDPGMAACKVALRLMRAQPFIDGNKRTAVIFANHYLISHGAGILSIPREQVQEFRERLVGYYEDNNEAPMAQYLYDTCLVKMQDWQD